MDLLERLQRSAVDRDSASMTRLLLDAHEAIEQLRAQVQMLGEEPVA